MNDSLKKEYNTYFSKFYKDFYKYQTGSKKQLNCPHCSTKKRFIFNKNQLIFSCGPKHNKDKKCGPQYTIDLPKYINFRELYKFYDELINGSFEYKKDNLLEYDLEKIKDKIDVTTSLKEQIDSSKESQKLFETLLIDYNKTNQLDDYKELLESLSKKRYKNSIDKKKIMKKLINEEL